MRIETIDQLRTLYGFPSEKAIKKSLPELDEHSIHFIAKSPFFVLATGNEDGTMDVSPRGGTPGFVQVLSSKQILIPDIKGNKRIDSLVNIIATGRVGTLFLIPGVDETLRINGRAYISTNQELLERYAERKNPPISSIVIEVEEVFIHCAKSFMRSKLWDQTTQIDRTDFPTIGQILKDQLNTEGEPESQEAMLKRYQGDL
ncbi:MAG: pyridoxamine 5'-phosphate oxidase family protein [Bacteroidota bacterium]